MHSSAKKLHRVLNSNEIRKTFIDYFVHKHDHKFVRSSPVVPFCDPTLAFVNAGMNQFKTVFLGKTQPPYRRVVNSQKCVRVGGKHNDLTIVGTDGYHHTFFEMLGNWSFGNYFKREACQMALELLRGPFQISTNRLYVTYFAGDKVLGLPADLESFEIWRSLGFPAERILPFDSADNFWEMGTSGPCGPCTEIHIDHQTNLVDSKERSKLVNAGRADLTELWNLVFIQYNRNEDGTITPLPSQHVDTGMGFERLTAILQNKLSNYDTDLFVPIFQNIQKICKTPQYGGNFPTQTETATLDTGYRILADHARMVTICLTDGMLPDQNQKLRRVLRKAFNICENVFRNETLITQLVPIIVESLGTAYPELSSKQTAVIELINHEQEVYKAIRSASTRAFNDAVAEFPNLDNINMNNDDLIECPGFVPAYREFQAQKPNFHNRIMPGNFLYKLYDTYGLDEKSFQKLADLENMECDMQGYKSELLCAKMKTKQNSNISANTSTAGEFYYDIEEQKRTEKAIAEMTSKLPNTDDSYKYAYTYDIISKEYDIPKLKAKITGILHKGGELLEFSPSFMRAKRIHIVTDITNFYHESGGQQSDSGNLIIVTQFGDIHELPIVSVRKINGCIVHNCEVPDTLTHKFRIECDSEVILEVDNERRKLNICHHTATHLLNAAIRSLFNKVTYQVSSSVTSDNCKLEVGIIGKRITREDVEKIEDLIGRIICAGISVQVDTMDVYDVLQQNDITMVPGEIYPDTGIRLVSIDCEPYFSLISKELCCGTHAFNTREIEYFSITNLKQTNRARYAFTAVAGPKAEKVLKAAALIEHRVDNLEKELKTDKLTNATELELQKIRHSILHTKLILPYAFKVGILERIKDILKKIKELQRTTLKEFVDVEIKNLLHEKPYKTHPYLLHYLRSSALMEEIPLTKAVKLCSDRPVLFIAKCNHMLKARCVVPKKFIDSNFDAQLWLKEFAAIFDGQLVVPKVVQSSDSICYMKSKKVSAQFDELLEIAMERANNFARKHLM